MVIALIRQTQREMPNDNATPSFAACTDGPSEKHPHPLLHPCHGGLGSRVSGIVDPRHRVPDHVHDFPGIRSHGEFSTTIGTLTITGGFRFDPEPGTGPGTEGPTLVSADSTAEKAPPTSILIQGMVETFDTPILPLNPDAFSIVAEASATSDAIKINFAAPLGITPDDITEVMVFNNNPLLTVSSAPNGSVTGQAIPIPFGASVPIPEPASLTLRGGLSASFCSHAGRTGSSAAHDRIARENHEARCKLVAAAARPSTPSLDVGPSGEGPFGLCRSCS